MALTVVLGVDVIVGVSFTLLTVMVKDCVSTAPAASVAFNTTLWVPTSALVGVPDKTPVFALKESHDGFVGVDKVTVSPISTSFATKV